MKQALFEHGSREGYIKEIHRLERDNEYLIAKVIELTKTVETFKIGYAALKDEVAKMLAKLREIK